MSEVRVRMGEGQDAGADEVVSELRVQLTPAAQRAVDAWLSMHHSSGEQKTTSGGEEEVANLLGDALEELRSARLAVQGAGLSWTDADPIYERVDAAKDKVRKALGKYLAESAMAETAAECERDEGERGLDILRKALRTLPDGERAWQKVVDALGEHAAANDGREEQEQGDRASPRIRHLVLEEFAREVGWRVGKDVQCWGDVIDAFKCMQDDQAVLRRKRRECKRLQRSLDALPSLDYMKHLEQHVEIAKRLFGRLWVTALEQIWTPTYEDPSAQEVARRVHQLIGLDGPYGEAMDLWRLGLATDELRKWNEKRYDERMEAQEDEEGDEDDEDRKRRGRRDWTEKRLIFAREQAAGIKNGYKVSDRGPLRALARAVEYVAAGLLAMMAEGDEAEVPRETAGVEQMPSVRVAGKQKAIDPFDSALDGSE